MHEVISSVYIKTVVNEIAVKLNLAEWSYQEHKFECIAQNYFGILIPIVIKGKHSTKSVSFQIILKLAPTDDRYRVSGAVTLMFAREIFVYSKVLSRYEDLQQNFPSEFQFIFPSCYYSCKEYCKEVIAMQNMCEFGFKPYVQNSFLDIEHMLVSLRSLAKFHALSFILEEKESAVFESVKQICMPLTEKSNKRFMNILVNRLANALKIFENSIYTPLLEYYKQNCTAVIEAAVLSSENVCLCHGDIWKENILFKYENNSPVSACLIDYQTTRMCSPAFDVLYLIISSTESELRQEYFYKLLDIYYEIFVQFLTMGQLNPDKIYSRNHFHGDLKVVAPACFIIANTALWLSNGLQQEGHVKSKLIWHTEADKAKAVDKYKKTIKNILDDFCNYGYIDIKN